MDYDIPNALGSRTLYNHQSTGVLNKTTGEHEKGINEHCEHLEKPSGRNGKQTKLVGDVGGDWNMFYFPIYWE